MKRIFTLLVAALAFVACTQNDVEELTANRADLPETLTVGFEGDDTRIQLNEAQKTVWNAGDEVSVFYQSYTNMKWTFQGEDGDRSGVLKAEDKNYGEQVMDDIIIVYPYSSDYRIILNDKTVLAELPVVQHYLNGSYGKGGNIMVTAGDFDSYLLRSVCGWLRIDLTGEGQKVRKISLQGNNGEQLAGLIYVDTATAESTLASEMGSADDNNAGGNLVFDDSIITELTLDCGEGVELGEKATAFYFAVPPQTFVGGFTVDVECEDYEPMTISTENSVTIQRNTIQPMASIAFEGEEVISYNEIRYTATAKVKANSNYPWSFDTFGANILSHDFNEESGEGVITFDADVTTIGDKAFYFCSSLTSITIPDSVTTIGSYAFYYCSSLTSVTIPDSVTTIGEWAFYNCDSLTSVTIGNSVTSIGGFAFCGCNSLTSVTIPDSVNTIGEWAFGSCSSLTSVTIPDSVTGIGEHAFGSCGSLTAFYGKYASEDNRCLVVDGILKYFAPAELTEYNIPGNVIKIDISVFENCDSLTSITIPDSVTEIGDSVFENCDSLTSITIPDSVTKIGNSAFESCSSLTSITISDSVTEIGEKAFYSCSSLTSITIPDSVTSIGNSAFSFCGHLTSLTIGNGVTSIGGYAFEYCSSLTSITIPNSVTEIGSSAFAECTGELIINSKSFLEKDYTSTTYPTYDYSGWLYRSRFSSLVFGDNVTKIGNFVFKGCYRLTSVTIPDSVTKIGDSAFNGCSSLTSVTIPNSVTEIGFAAFSGSSSLISVTIGNGVTSIGNWAFGFCSSLTSVIIGNNVTSIGNYTFSNCSSLTSVTIPDRVTTIGYSAFASCSSLASVTIPDSVTEIERDTFSYCSSLTSVTIPESVTSIGEMAFYQCSSLTSVYCKPSTPPAGGSYMFYFNASDRKIYVPTASVEAYKTTKYWSEYDYYIVGYDFEKGEVVE